MQMQKLRWRLVLWLFQVSDDGEVTRVEAACLSRASRLPAFVSGLLEQPQSRPHSALHSTTSCSIPRRLHQSSYSRRTPYRATATPPHSPPILHRNCSASATTSKLIQPVDTLSQWPVLKHSSPSPLFSPSDSSSSSSPPSSTTLHTQSWSSQPTCSHLYQT